MNRRGFIGSVIGTVVGLSVPFIAQAAPTVKKLPGSLVRTRKYLELLENGEKAIAAGQFFLVLEDGKRIRGPAIKSVKMYEAPGKNYPTCKAVVTAHIVNVTQSITYKGVVYVTPDGYELTSKNFYASVPATNGDQLHITYTLSIGGDD